MEKTAGESTKKRMKNTSYGVSVVALKSRLVNAMAFNKKEVKKRCESRGTQISVSEHLDDEKAKKGFIGRGSRH